MRELIYQKNIGQVIFIDIFILDYVPSDLGILYKSMKKHRRLTLRFKSLRKRFYRAKDKSGCKNTW